MAKGDVVLKFDAQTAEFIQKVMAARSALDETAKTARSTGEAVAKTGDSTKRYTEKMADFTLGLVKLAAVPTTLMGVVELAMQAAERRVQRLEQRADAVAARSSSMSSTVYSLGAEKDRDKINAGIESMAGRKYGQSTFSPATAETLFKAIRTGAGDNADVSRTMAATAEGLRAMGSGADEQQAAELGTGIVNLMSLVPGMGAEEAANLSHESLVLAPGLLRDKASIRLIARAKDRRQMLKMLIAAERAEVPPKTLATIQTDMLRRGRTMEDALQNPNMLPLDQREMMRAISGEMAGLPAVSDVSETVSDAVSGRGPGDAIAIAKANEQEKVKTRLGSNPTPELVQQELRKMAISNYNQKFPNDWFSGLTAHDFRMGVYDQPDRWPKGNPGPDSMAEALREMVEILKEQNGTSRDIAEQLRQANPLLRTEKEGQK